MIVHYAKALSNSISLLCCFKQGEQGSEGLPVQDNVDDPSVYVANSGKVLTDTGIWDSLSSGYYY